MANADYDPHEDQMVWLRERGTPTHDANGNPYTLPQMVGMYRKQRRGEPEQAHHLGAFPFADAGMFHGHNQTPSFQGLLDHAAQAYRHMLNGGMVNLGGLMGWNPAYAYQNFMPWMYGVAQPGQMMGMNQMGGE